MTEAREAFERHEAKVAQVPYEEFKLRFDSYEEKIGERYIDGSLRHKHWVIWLASWQEQQKMIDALKAENAELHSANVNMLNAKLSMQKSIDDAENYLHVALNSVDDETLCKSYLLSAVNALRGGSHD